MRYCILGTDNADAKGKVPFGLFRNEVAEKPTLASHRLISGAPSVCLVCFAYNNNSKFNRLSSFRSIHRHYDTLSLNETQLSDPQLCRATRDGPTMPEVSQLG